MASLSDYVTPEQLMTSSNKATALEQNYQGLSSQSSSLPIKLKAALQEHLGYNEDLAKMRADAISGMTTARPVAQEKYASVFDPFARSKLISQYVADQQYPLTLANTLLDQRGQTVSDIVNATSGLFSGIVGAAQGDASAANNSYNRLYNMYQQGVAEQQAQQKQQQDLLLASMKNPVEYRPIETANGIYLYDPTTGQLVSRLGDTKPTGGGGSSSTDIEAYLQALQDETNRLAAAKAAEQQVQDDYNNNFDAQFGSGNTVTNAPVTPTVASQFNSMSNYSRPVLDINRLNGLSTSGAVMTPTR